MKQLSFDLSINRKEFTRQETDKAFKDAESKSKLIEELRDQLKRYNRISRVKK